MEQMSQDKRLAQQIAEFLVKERYEDLPQETIDKVKEFVLDVIGCTVGASQQPQIDVLTEVLSAEGGNPESSVFAHGFRTSTSTTITGKGPCTRQ